MMWVLLVLGGFALLLGIERTLYLHRGQIKAKAFIDGIKNMAEDSGLGAIAIDSDWLVL